MKLEEIELPLSKTVRNELYQTMKLRGKFSYFIAKFKPLTQVFDYRYQTFDYEHNNLRFSNRFTLLNNKLERINISNQFVSDEMAEKIKMARYILYQLEYTAQTSVFIDSILEWYINDLLYKNNKEHYNKGIKTPVEYGGKYGILFAIFGMFIMFEMVVSIFSFTAALVLFSFYAFSLYYLLNNGT